MKNLDTYDFSTKKGFNSILIKLRYQEFAKYFKGDSCIEFGCADGEGTKILLNYFKRVVGVDGSRDLISKISREIKSERVEFIYSFFEKLDIGEKFDVVFLGHVLEHVDDPIATLLSAKKCMKKNSIMIVDVPNALSVHRQVGVLMGLIKTEYSLNEADLSIGHQRVYDMDKLRKDIDKAGLKVISNGGLFLKSFSNAQLNTMLDERGIYAFNEVGKKYPNIAAEIYVICELP